MKNLENLNLENLNVFHEVKSFFNDPFFSDGLPMLAVLFMVTFFILGLKIYSDSDSSVRRLGGTAYLLASVWAMFVPIALGILAAVVGLAVSGVLFTIKSWFGLGVTLLALFPTLLAYGLILIGAMGFLLGVREFIAKRTVKLVAREKTSPPLGVAKMEGLEQDKAL